MCNIFANNDTKGVRGAKLPWTRKTGADGEEIVNVGFAALLTAVWLT